jgi:hypothetical protein
VEPSPFFRRSRYFVAATRIFLGQHAAVLVVLEAELLDDLVTTDAAEVITLRIEEKALDQGAGICRSGRITRSEAAINILQRFLFVLRLDPS